MDLLLNTVCGHFNKQDLIAVSNTLCVMTTSENQLPCQLKYTVQRWRGSKYYSPSLPNKAKCPDYSVLYSKASLIYTIHRTELRIYVHTNECLFRGDIYLWNSSCTVIVCVYNNIILLQFCDDVVMGMFPVSQEKLLKLAALRLQYLDGDYSAGSIMYVLS